MLEWLGARVNKKIEKGLATRREIVEIATRLFAEHGYAGVSIEAVLAACGISRGALYHHFSSKEVLFEAVVEAIEVSIAEATVRRSEVAPRDAIKALRAGCDAFLDLAQERAVRQIVLIDAPAVLGWEKWREIDARHGFGLIKAAVERLSAEGALPADMVHIFAHMLIASLFEMALLIARADDREAAAKLGKMGIQRMLARMLDVPGAQVAR
jgi:AcrR family transcriptional regulator